MSSCPYSGITCTLIGFRYDQALRNRQNRPDGISQDGLSTARFHWWDVIVAVSFQPWSSLCKNRLIFGDYSTPMSGYPPRGANLLLSVYVAGMLLTSFGLVQRFTALTRPVWLSCAASCCTDDHFRYFMEFTAVKLNYWQWERTGSSFFVAPCKIMQHGLPLVMRRAQHFAMALLFAANAAWRFTAIGRSNHYFAMVALGKA